jgi:hypothetical protein
LIVLVLVLGGALGSCAGAALFRGTPRVVGLADKTSERLVRKVVAQMDPVCAGPWVSGIIVKRFTRHVIAWDCKIATFHITGEVAECNTIRWQVFVRDRFGRSGPPCGPGDTSSVR